MEACGEGWEENGEHCYLWSSEKKNWTAAEDFCLQEGGHLASVTSIATNDFVLEGMRGLSQFWLGGNDIEEEGAWKWTDCTPWEDTFWLSGEPNNGWGAEDCLEVKHGKWNDRRCFGEQGFVCSKKICSGRIYQE